MLGLSYINSLEPWSGFGTFSLLPIRKVLQHLNNPQDAFKSVHIAGTNGKGSVAATVSSILQCAGYKVGLTISPHLLNVNERIKINGIDITDKDLDKLALDIKDASLAVKVTLTYHEALTAISFHSFASSSVDFAVIEVGLGGRLDSSNVISRSAISAITSISLDHTSMLGESFVEIAQEKAGVVKSYSNTVVGELPEDALKVIQMWCSEKRTSLSVYGEDYSIYKDQNEKVTYTDNYGDIELEVALNGLHQVKNAAVACRIGRLLGVSTESCKKGIESVRWPCRLEWRKVGLQNVLFDCAHNGEGIRSFISYIKEQKITPIRLIFGVLDTKDWQNMVRELISHVSAWYLIEPASKRAVSSESIQKLLSGIGISKSTIVHSTNELVSLLEEEKDAESCVAAIGSMYLLAELLKVDTI
jgi:dihydrofolate synthase / folylpolyglutamate synthase